MGLIMPGNIALIPLRDLIGLPGSITGVPIGLDLAADFLNR